MKLTLVILFVAFLRIESEPVEKYLPLKQKCQRTPKDAQCLQLKTKFTQLLDKCLKLQSKDQVDICLQVKQKLCYIFPSTCLQATTKRVSSTKSKSIISTLSTPTTTTKSTISSTVSNVLSKETDEEFVRVPIDPSALRTRGEYCIRHGKEKKCQDLLVNLKNTYSSCKKKKPEPTTPTPTKPDQLDCHSFQTHLCQAFPKFPPCLKKTPT